MSDDFEEPAPSTAVIDNRGTLVTTHVLGVSENWVLTNAGTFNRKTRSWVACDEVKLAFLGTQKEAHDYCRKNDPDQQPRPKETP